MIDCVFLMKLLLSLPGRSALLLCQFFGSLIQDFILQGGVAVSLLLFLFLLHRKKTTHRLDYSNLIKTQKWLFMLGVNQIPICNSQTL